MDTIRRNELTEEELAQVRKAMEDFGSVPMMPVVKAETAEVPEPEKKPEVKQVKKRKGWIVWTAVAVAVAVALIAVVGFGIWREQPKEISSAMAERCITMVANDISLAVIQEDGTLYFEGASWFEGDEFGIYEPCDRSQWYDLTYIDMKDKHLVGVRKDGKVVYAGNPSYDCGRECTQWTGVTAVSAGNEFTVGLRWDGTVLAAGDNNFGQCDVEDWENIVGISAGNYFTVGLRSDGTLITTDMEYQGSSKGGPPIDEYSIAEVKNALAEVATWENIAAVSVGRYWIMGLKTDGTVVVAGNSFIDYLLEETDLNDWTDITSVRAGDILVGTHSDGSIELARQLGYIDLNYKGKVYFYNQLAEFTKDLKTVDACYTRNKLYLLDEKGTVYCISEVLGNESGMTIVVENGKLP